MAQRLGFKSATAMDKFLNYAIKVGTDGFKTQVDSDKVRRQLAVVQSNVTKLFGSTAPWTGWPDEWAFRRGVPAFFSGEMSEVEKKHAVKPFMDGTVAQICRITLPSLKSILETPIKVRPLSEYRNWGMRVPEEQYGCAKVIQDWYNARVQRVNFSDPSDIALFRDLLAEEVENWIFREGIDRRVAASALWRVAHASRSEDAAAASVFMAFPDECLWIVREKPGLRDSRLTTILTGLHYQVPGLAMLDTEVEIVDVEVRKGAKLIIRKALVAEVQGQDQPSDSRYPENMLGLVAQNADQPETGRYFASVRQISSAAWKCDLVTA